MNRHFSPGAALIGLVFIALGLMFLMDEQNVIRIRPMLVIPIVLIALGLGVLAGIAQPERES